MEALGAGEAAAEEAEVVGEGAAAAVEAVARR